jgi:hypothetical protein
MPSSRQARVARRGLVAAGAAVVFVSACDTTSTFRPNEQNWGFIYLSALRTTGGEYRTAPNASFFRGAVTSVPDARVRTDSCFAAGEYIPPTPGSSITGVTYLDAGQAITANIGGTATPIPRVSGSTISYALAAGNTVAYRPGDSVVITVPGITGGFPASEVRGRSAEPFTFEAIQASTSSIPLRWTAATDPNSALIVSLQYTPAGSGARAQEIRCAFTDDGVDSIPLRQHQAWSATSNVARNATFTRLRTSIVQVNGGAMELISTLTLPTPQP